MYALFLAINIIVIFFILILIIIFAYLIIKKRCNKKYLFSVKFSFNEFLKDEKIKRNSLEITKFYLDLENIFKRNSIILNIELINPGFLIGYQGKNIIKLENYISYMLSKDIKINVKESNLWKS